jgi:hypothetical protein
MAAPPPKGLLSTSPPGGLPPFGRGAVLAAISDRQDVGNVPNTAGNLTSVSFPAFPSFPQGFPSVTRGSDVRMQCRTGCTKALPALCRRHKKRCPTKPWRAIVGQRRFGRGGGRIFPYIKTILFMFTQNCLA